MAATVDADKAASAADDDAAPAAEATELDDSYLQEHLEALAEGYSISDPPALEVIRRVRPEEQSSLVAQCMTERGWTVTIDPDDGGIVARVPVEQVPALNESWYICWGSYPPHEQYLRPMNESELRRLYSYYADTLTPCLRGQGYDITPPSRDSWLEDAEAGDDYWVPYAEIESPVPPEVARQCPLNPEDSAIYGD